MDAVGYIRQNFNLLHRYLGEVRRSETASTVHWLPRGGTCSVAWLLWHTARSEDFMVHYACQRTPQVWSDSWAERLRLPPGLGAIGTGDDPDEARALRIADLEAFGEYVDAVYAATDAYLAGLTESDLDRRIRLGDREETVGENLSLHLVTHLAVHLGEMGTIRGLREAAGAGD